MKKKLIEVNVAFLYEEESGKDLNYYRQKAFDEIYNSDDVLPDFAFEVKEK